MADNPWTKLIGEEVDEFARLVDKNYRIIVDTIFPSLIERDPPENRKAFYSTLDWEALRNPETGDPYLWEKLTKDALTLGEQEQRDMNRAFFPQVKPQPILGLSVGDQDKAGMRTLMPLGSFGG